MVLKCHYCDGTLESGEARIHGTITGFLLFGFSHQNLYFKTESGEESEVLGSGMSTPAMKCDKCGGQYSITLPINIIEPVIDKPFCPQICLSVHETTKNK